MLTLDHLAVAAVTLLDGVAAVEEALGVSLAGGGEHPLMGTHNRLIGLDDVYLEVISINPDHREAHFNLALTYLGMKSPKIELVRRHYDEAKRLGAAPHPGIEKMLRKTSE